MQNLSIEALEDYIMSLFIAKQTCNEIISKIKKLNITIDKDEFVEINSVRNGDNIKIIFKIINYKLPKCWVVGYQYKFNSYIFFTFDYPINEKELKC